MNRAVLKLRPRTVEFRDESEELFDRDNGNQRKSDFRKRHFEPRIVPAQSDRGNKSEKENHRARNHPRADRTQPAEFGNAGLPGEKRSEEEREHRNHNADERNGNRLFRQSGTRLAECRGNRPCNPQSKHHQHKCEKRKHRRSILHIVTVCSSGCEPDVFRDIEETLGVLLAFPEELFFIFLFGRASRQHSADSCGNSEESCDGKRDCAESVCSVSGPVVYAAGKSGQQSDRQRVDSGEDRQFHGKP